MKGFKLMSKELHVFDVNAYKPGCAYLIRRSNGGDPIHALLVRADDLALTFGYLDRYNIMKLVIGIDDIETYEVEEMVPESLVE